MTYLLRSFFANLVHGTTQTWRGRIARMLAFVGGWVYANALVAHSEHGDPDRIVLAIIVGIAAYFASFMLGD